jgi:hypothetical protein
MFAVLEMNAWLYALTAFAIASSVNFVPLVLHQPIRKSRERERR